MGVFLSLKAFKYWVKKMPNEESYLNESLRKIAKGAGIGFTGTAIGMVFGFFTRAIIARFLGPGDYGLISLGVAGLSIAATIGLLGLPAGITRYVSFYKGKGDKGRIKGTIISALKISFPISIILACLLFFGANWISVNVFHDADLTQILQIFAIAIPFWCLAQIFLCATIGFQDMRYKAYVEDIFQNVFKLAVIILLLYLGFGVLGATRGWALAIIVMSFLAFYFLEKRVFPVFNTKVKAISIDRELFSFSLPLIFTAVAGMVMGWMDTLMLGYFLTASAVGIYNVALPTARLLAVSLSSFSVIFMPVISELYSKNAIEDLRNTYSAVTKWVFSLVMPAFLLMALFSQWILKIMFGTEFVEGALALSILAFGYLIICIVGPTNQILTAYGRTEIVMGCSFVGASLNFCLNYLLIPIYGINGAAIATGLSLAVMNSLHLFFIYRIAKIQPFRKTYLKPFFASIISISVVYVMTKYVVGVSFFVLIGMFFIFLLIYFFLLLIFKSFEEEDLTIMRAIDERLGTKSDWLRKIIRKFL